MTVATLINRINQVLPAADQSVATDFYHPTANGIAISAAQKSWRLTIDKTGVPAGVKYLVYAVEYQYSTGWALDVGNAPDGWLGGPNFNDDGSQDFIDHAASEIGTFDANHNLIGERPTRARIHIIFSNGSVLPSVVLQVADDFSLA